LHRYTFLSILCMALAPVHSFTNPMHGACTGTQFYQPYAWRLHRYTVLSSLCMALAPVHVFTNPMHGACTGTQFYQPYAWRLHRYTVFTNPMHGACTGTQFLPTLPGPIINRPESRRCAGLRPEPSTLNSRSATIPATQVAGPVLAAAARQRPSWSW
jgi:hypothetical protein